ncbi:vWA domain-containing protein [Ornithinibacillus californiensis]|uniref:vWA domain-containing protein n=1 Tax=Ornithinibacillus californiensis TaxID=161536 RepID=UPI00064DEAEF|nr:vWA domain-containing protein [Ornithinibacillus californiensis]
MKRKTEIIFLLDRSGSMAGLEKDTIGGFNALIKKQCQLEGETVLTTVLFDNEYELLWNGVNANKVRLTEKEYYVRGSTALLDAIGRTITDVSYRLSGEREKEIPSNVLFVITTDGMENSSRQYSYEQVNAIITKQQENHGWEFIFLGANMDAAAEAQTIGIKAEQAFNFEADDEGVDAMYSMLHEEISLRR